MTLWAAIAEFALGTIPEIAFVFVPIAMSHEVDWRPLNSYRSPQLMFEVQDYIFISPLAIFTIHPMNNAWGSWHSVAFLVYWDHSLTVCSNVLQDNFSKWNYLALGNRLYHQPWSKSCPYQKCTSLWLYWCISGVGCISDCCYWCRLI